MAWFFCISLSTVKRSSIWSSCSFALLAWETLRIEPTSFDLTDLRNSPSPADSRPEARSVSAVLAVLAEESDVASAEAIVDKLCFDGVRRMALLLPESAMPGLSPCCFGAAVQSRPRKRDAALLTLGRKLCLPTPF